MKRTVVSTGSSALDESMLCATRLTIDRFHRPLPCMQIASLRRSGSHQDPATTIRLQMRLSKRERVILEGCGMRKIQTALKIFQNGERHSLLFLQACFSGCAPEVLVCCPNLQA